MKTLLFVLALLLPSQVFAQVQQNVVVVFDDSGSMSGNLGDTSRMEAAKASLTKVLTNLPPNTNLGIVTLNGRWEEENWLLPFGPVNKDIVRAKITSLSPTGGTPLGGCMKAGCDVLLAKRAKQKHGVYKLIVVTDGEAGDQGLVERYTPDIMTRGITVDCIGVGMSGDHTLATKVNNYYRANDPNQFVTALQATFAEVSYKDPAAANEDFQMLAAIPDDMPTKVIDALLDSGNHPIGETPVVIVNQQTGEVTVSPPSEGFGAFGVCMIIFSLIFVVILVLFVIAKNS